MRGDVWKSANGRKIVRVVCAVCDRCEYKGECVLIAQCPAPNCFVELKLCTMRCWSNLIDAIDNEETLES